MSAKKKPRKKFDWLTKLDALCRRTTSLTLANAVALHERASHWPTCACGQLCARLPRMSNGAPEDDLLWTLGNRFARQISLGKWRSARTIFCQIEARTNILLKQ